MITSSRLFTLLWIIALFFGVYCRVEFTNLQCIPLDTQFAEFDGCYLKSVNRSYKYMSLKVKLYKVPITNVTVKVAMLKRLNGYTPFLYNVTFDACKFLEKPYNPLLKYFYEFITEHTNMNHTCPYDHDIIVEKVAVSFVNHRLTEVLPFPEGDYAVYLSWMAYGINRANVNIFFTLS